MAIRPSNQSKISATDARFSGRGSPSAEEWGFFRCNAELRPECSINELALRFNVAKGTLHRGLARPLGAMTSRPPTLDDDDALDDDDGDEERREAIKHILRKMPKASVSQVHTVSQVHSEVVRQNPDLSQSTVYRDSKEVATRVLLGRPTRPTPIPSRTCGPFASAPQRAILSADLSKSKGAREALWAALKREWASYPSDSCKRLAVSFASRLEICIRKKGGPNGCQHQGFPQFPCIIVAFPKNFP
jgi:hypothetical protein